eukprot:gene21447-28415_t
MAAYSAAAAAAASPSHHLHQIGALGNMGPTGRRPGIAGTGGMGGTGGIGGMSHASAAGPVDQAAAYNAAYQAVFAQTQKNTMLMGHQNNAQPGFQRPAGQLPINSDHVQAGAAGGLHSNMGMPVLPTAGSRTGNIKAGRSDDAGRVVRGGPPFGTAPPGGPSPGIPFHQAPQALHGCLDHDSLMGLAPGLFASKYESVDEVVGKLMYVAQDQNGCRFLQRKFDEQGPAAVAVVFPEILDNIVELMVDPFGNYLVQKLLERCSEQQRLEKLIETLTTKEQHQLVVKMLRNGVNTLIKDWHGNHVVQRCLQRFPPDDAQFIYDAAMENCVQIASHRHGCCVLQRCLDFSSPSQRRTLVNESSPVTPSPSAR